jgi:hypothetical protein
MSGFDQCWQWQCASRGVSDFLTGLRCSSRWCFVASEIQRGAHLPSQQHVHLRRMHGVQLPGLMLQTFHPMLIPVCAAVQLEAQLDARDEQMRRCVGMVGVTRTEMVACCVAAIASNWRTCAWTASATGCLPSRAGTPVTCAYWRLLQYASSKLELTRTMWLLVPADPLVPEAPCAQNMEAAPARLVILTHTWGAQALAASAGHALS